MVVFLTGVAPNPLMSTVIDPELVVGNFNKYVTFLSRESIPLSPVPPYVFGEFSISPT
jgi:hypothetical protein